MNMTPDFKKKAAAIAGFVVVAAGVLYFELSDSGAPAPVVQPAPAAVTAPAPVATSAGPVRVSGPAAKTVGTTSASLDPTLRMQPMLVAESLTYSGSGRNIFSASSAPVEMPKPVAPARPKGPVVVAPVAPQGPPPPPPIDLKFFGTALNSSGIRSAFLLHGDDVFLASNGEVVQRRYKVITVSANSVLVEDMTNSNRQTLPLIGH